MARRRKPSYFRSLVNLVPAVIAGGAVWFTDVMHGVLCSRMPVTAQCGPMLPTWLYLAALGVVFASVSWTCWAWYKDHVQGEYIVDLTHGADRYRD